MPKLAASVGAKIRSIRKSRGLTQEQLGEKVQQPQSYVGGIERGEKNISLDTLEKISNALAISPAELFNSYPNPVSKDQLERDKLTNSINIVLQKRSLSEIRVLSKFIEDVIKVFDSKK
jgi:transcriptional regulator with XRE-family HTH domain